MGPLLQRQGAAATLPWLQLLLLLLPPPQGPGGWIRCPRGKVRPQHLPLRTTNCLGHHTVQ